MNRSNSGASFDIIHICIDAFVQILSFFIAFSFGWDNAYTETDLKPFVSIYLVCIIIYLLFNRSLYVYNNTIFFYMDRIIRRETFSFMMAVLCGALYLSMYRR